MKDALFILGHVACGTGVRLTEDEDMTMIIPALTTYHRGTLERLTRSKEKVRDEDDILALDILGDAAKLGGVTAARAYVEAGTAALAVDFLKEVYDPILEGTSLEHDFYVCAALVLGLVCELVDDAATLRALVDAGATRGSPSQR